MSTNVLETYKPETPSLIPVLAAAIEKITQLQGLSCEEREWLAINGHELRAKAGEIIFEEGQPAEYLILILKGEIHVRRSRSGAMALFIGRSGQMTGLLPFSRMVTSGGQGYAAHDVWAILLHKDLFPAMLEAIPSMAQISVSTLLDRVREVTRIEQQSEKLTALGKLAGNLAHELNNPSSAAQRAASGILTEIQSVSNGRLQLVSLCLKPEQMEAVLNWESCVRERAKANLELQSADASLREEAISRWLEEHRLQNAWQIAPELAELGVEASDLNPLRGFIDTEAMQVILEQFASSLRAEQYAQAMLHSTTRIFDLISAIKTYSYMDRAPILEVDVCAGVDATIQMLQSRMKNIHIVRDYEHNMPTISAYGSELNQVWMVLIENALEALARVDRTNGPDQQGCLRVVCRQEADMILVEVWDDGPEIPKDLQDRIFEPFFTTKAPGQGLGLGLDTATRIVRKHRGHLGVKSEDGATCFLVRLPINQLQAY